MKKRLHYAMPRVPLEKLKPNTKDQGPDNEPVSHVGTMAKKNLVCKAKS